MKKVNLNVDKFLGLHSDALGDTELAVGELSDMKNFKVTEGYNLEKRNGCSPLYDLTAPSSIRGQWNGVLNGEQEHIFASGGHVWRVPKGTYAPTTDNATITAGTPAVINKDAHGLVAGDKIVFTSKSNGLDNLGKSVSFSKDGKYMVAAQSSTPYVRFYRRNVETFEDFAIAAGDMPTTTVSAVAFSWDNKYLAIGIDESPYVLLYSVDGGAFNKLDSPATIPTGTVRSIDFSRDNLYLAVSYEVSPYVTVYSISNGTFTALENTETYPGSETHPVLGVSFSPNSGYLATVCGVTPFLNIFKRVGNEFEKVDDPEDLPPDTGCTGCAFSADGVYLSVTTQDSPYLIIYKYNSLTGAFAKLANPASLPSGDAYFSAWSENGTYLSIATHTTPYVKIYKRAGDVFTALSNPSVIPTAHASCVAWYSNAFLAITYWDEPYLTVYSRSNDTFTALDTPKFAPYDIAFNTVYYVLATDLSANTFKISATSGGAAINVDSTFVNAGYTVSSYFEDLGTLTDAKTEFFQFVDTDTTEYTYIDTEADFGSSTSYNKVAQTFKTNRDIVLTSVTLALSKNASPTDNVSCAIFATTGGAPTGSALATATNVVNGETLTGTISLQTFYFESFDISANTTYAIVLSKSGAVNSTNYYEVWGDNTNAYSGGAAYRLNGSTWETIGSLAVPYDFFFSISSKPVYSIYIMNGFEYKKWTGFGNIADVSGYVPLIFVGTIPAGTTKTENEQLNSLTGKKRQTFNGDASATDFYIAEKNVDSIDYAKVNGYRINYTATIAEGKVEFASAPSTGVDNVEIGWTKGTGSRTDIINKTNAILYGGKNDTRVFVYGDGNDVRYSELADGVLSAEYFPSLNYISAGSRNSDVNLLTKQYDRLLIHTETETLWASYNYDETLGASLEVYPLNDSIGCSVKGAGQLVRNNPYVLFGNKIYEFVASNVRDERNAVLKSLRVQTLLDAETMTSAITFDNEEDGEFWLCLGTEAYIYSYELNVWYYYTFPFTVTSICDYGGQVMLGTSGGQLMLMDSATTDNGVLIDAYANTGYIDYGTIMERKFVNFIWLSMYLDGTNSSLNMYYQTDKDDETLVEELSYSTETKPQTIRMKPKMKKFVYGKFIFKNSSDDKCRILGISAPAIIGGIAK